MANWIPPTTSLSGNVVDLIPLSKAYFDELEQLAKEKRIWEFYVVDGSNSEKFLSGLNHALVLRDKGEQHPFVIFHKQQKKVIGGTRFMDIQPNHKKLEIGWTWLHPDYWGTEINFECKLLLLTYCFEVLQTYRVQFKTDENNMRSRKAIEKIGGKFEGILRHDMVRDNGTKRNSAYFSIIDREWVDVKPVLLKKSESREVGKSAS